MNHVVTIVLKTVGFHMKLLDDTKDLNKCLMGDMMIRIVIKISGCGYVEC